MSLDQVPQEKLKQIFNSIKQSISWRLRYYFRYSANKLRYGHSYRQPFRLLNINPKKVKYYLLNSDKTNFHLKHEMDDEIAHLHELDMGAFKTSEIGRIVDGNWDKNKRNWNNRCAYKCFYKVFEKNYDWKNTEHIQKLLNQIEAGHGAYGYSSKDEFLNNRIPFLESLYRSIKKEGYKKQKDLDDHRSGGILHEAGVNIGRDGELIFNNLTGQHRLAMAKVVGLETIPVIVIARHKRWQDMKREVHIADSINELGPQQIKNLSHPDMKHITENKSW